mgnify:CR=1 FL=1
MKRVIGCAILTLWVSSAGGVFAAGFKSYPGAKLDESASATASKVQSGTQVEVYITKDGFEKVSAFYKGLCKEYAMPAKPPKLESGQIVQWGFFIVDGGKDLTSSRHWFKVQRPYVGSTKMAGGKAVFADVRDVTVIEVVRRR